MYFQKIQEDLSFVQIRVSAHSASLKMYCEMKVGETFILIERVGRTGFRVVETLDSYDYGIANMIANVSEYEDAVTVLRFEYLKLKTKIT